MEPDDTLLKGCVVLFKLGLVGLYYLLIELIILKVFGFVLLLVLFFEADHEFVDFRL